MIQSLILGTVPQERRVEIFDRRIVFYLFWISVGDQPIVSINPNITEFATKLKNGVETEIGGITLNSETRLIQFSGELLSHTVTVDGETLKVTLQRKDKRGEYDMEIELLVETVNP